MFSRVCRTAIRDSEGTFFFFKRKQLKQYQLTKINELIFPIDSDSSVSLKFGCFFFSKSEITLIETSQGKHIQDCTEKPLLRETQVGIILFNFRGTGFKNDLPLSVTLILFNRLFYFHWDVFIFGSNFEQLWVLWLLFHSEWSINIH